MHLSQQERPQRPSGRIEPGRLFPEPEEDFLYCLLRAGAVPQDPPRQPESRTGVAPVYLRQRFLVPAGDGHGQHDITGVTKVGPHF